MDVEWNVTASVLGFPVQSVHPPEILGQADDPANQESPSSNEQAEKLLKEAERRAQDLVWKASIARPSGLVFILSASNPNAAAQLDPGAEVNKSCISLVNLLESLQEEVDGFLLSLGAAHLNPNQLARGEALLHEIREAQLSLSKKIKDDLAEQMDKRQGKLTGEVTYVNTGAYRFSSVVVFGF